MPRAAFSSGLRSYPAKPKTCRSSPAFCGADYLASPARAEATLRRALLLAKSYQAVPDRPRLGGIALEGPDGTTLVTYERAIAIRFGDLGPHEVGPRLAAFDRAWRALNADEREAAHSLRIAETDRVTVAFGGMDQPWRR